MESLVERPHEKRRVIKKARETRCLLLGCNGRERDAL